MASESSDDRARSKSRIFISYSRKDIAFADRLELALRERGFVTSIDRAEIVALEDWWKRIETLITQADTVIFVLSPDALASDVCKKEVDFADSLNKRLAPVVLRRAADSDIPASLARLNFVFFDDPALFDQSLDRLVEALNTDISWVRSHTDIGEQARRWTTAGRPGPHGLLLRSPLLEQAERWIASRPEGAPLPTQDVIDFIAESRRGATRRRNILTSSLGAGLLVAVALAGLAYWQRSVAIDQRILAEGRQIAALANLGTSERLRGNWDSALKLGVYTAKLRSALGLSDAIDRAARSSLAGTVAQSALEVILAGHKGSVTSASFSPDGTRIVTSSLDHTAKIWMASTGELVSTIPQQDNPVYGARFSPDGSKIVTASNDFVSHIWDASTGRELTQLAGHEFYVTAAAFSPDGSRVVTASGDTTARVWDTHSGEQLLLLQGHESYVEDAAFNREGTKIVTASSDGTAIVWDAVTGKQLTKFEGHTNHVMSAVFDPKGDHVLSSGDDQTLRIWDAVSGKEIKTIENHDGYVTSGHFSPDGSKIVAVSLDGSARVWDAMTGDLIETMPGHEGPARHSEFSPDGSRVVTASEDGTARIWRLEYNVTRTINSEPVRPGKEVFPIKGTNFSPDGSKLLAVEHEDAVVWDVHTGKQLGLIDIDNTEIIKAVYTPDGKQILMLIADYSDREHPTTALQLWDATSFKQITTLYKGGDINLKLIGYSHDGRSILLIDGKSAIVLNATTGAASHTVTQENEGDIDNVALSPDDKHLAVVGQGRHVVHIWDLEKSADILQMSPKAVASDAGSSIRSIAFSPDGTRLLVSHNEYAIVWDAATGDTITELHGHSNRSSVTSSKFSPDGSRIVTAGSDNTVRVWDAVNGELIKTFRGHTGNVNAASFSPDGKFIVSESDDKTVRLWDAESAMMPTSRLIEVGCKRLAAFAVLNASEMHLIGLDHAARAVNVCEPDSR